MKKKVPLILVLLLGIMGTMFPKDPAVRFKRIQTDDGLAQNNVYCMLQDSKGFMWFGTQAGLNKYDGRGFTVYKPEPGNRGSLSSSFISSICEDRSGMIWVGTSGGGLNRFDPRKETFTRYRSNPDDPGCINSPYVTCICEDRSGSIWIGANGGGLSKLTRESGGMETFIHYGDGPEEPDNLGSNGVTSILQDRRGDIWVGTVNRGLKKYNGRTQKFSHFRRNTMDPGSLWHPNVQTVYEDRLGNIWVGAYGGGLFLLDRKTGAFTNYRHRPGDTGSLSNNNIRAILEDHSGVLWVGTDNGGLNRFDKRTETFISYMHDVNDPKSISFNEIYCLYEDRAHILWIGTEGGGLSIFDRMHKFDLYASNPHKTNSLSDGFIFSVYEDRSGILWIGTFNGGLNKYDREKDTFTHYRHIPGDPRSIAENRIRAITEDKTGAIWIGTDGRGVDRFDRAGETFTHYRYRPNTQGSLRNNNTRCLYIDSSDVLWVGTFGGGLNRFNRETGRFSTYLHQPGNPNSLGDNYIRGIIESHNEPGILWIATRNRGINRFDSRAETFERYAADPENPHALSDADVLSLLQDRSGTLWVGTSSGGLNKMVRRENKNAEFVFYSEKDGLSNNTVYGILEDEKGRLWLSTNKGISRFDPKKETFKNYNTDDGLQGNEYNSGAYFKTKSGEMFFGGINGLNAFYPTRIQKNSHIPPVVITGFRLFNKPMPIGGGSPLRESITWTTELKLSHNQDVFTFEFAALDFTVPGNNTYAYMMEGLDDQWTYTGAKKRFASYTNMPPGEFIFRVKGSNNDGAWNQTGAGIRIIITPPFWATWWFRLCVLLAVMAGVWFWYRGRLRNERLKTELQTARDTQLSIMPRFDPQIPGYDISAAYIPAYEVGGDFFDYIPLNPAKTKYCIAVGDVSGKTMKAAMTAVMTSGMIYLKANESSSVKEILEQVNRALCFKTEKQEFTALCLAVLDTESNEMVFANAGLNQPLLKTAGSVSKLPGAGIKFPLGFRPGNEYMEKKLRLNPGDMILFCTDGITEAKNSRLEFYGNDRLRALLEKMDTDSKSAAEIKEYIIQDVLRFSGGAPQHDDMTLVVVKRLK
jgi:ligand-binding sensor domain-containing protein